MSKQSGGLRDGLRLVRETVLYSPVFVALLVLTVLPYLVKMNLISETRLGTGPMIAFGVALGLVSALYTIRGPSPGSGGSGSSKNQVRDWGRQILDCGVNGEALPSDLDRLFAKAGEGSVGPEYLDAVLWCWLAARYQANVDLDRQMQDRVKAILSLDAEHHGGRYYYPRYQAWRLRAELRLRCHPAVIDCLPPLLPKP